VQRPQTRLRPVRSEKAVPPPGCLIRHSQRRRKGTRPYQSINKKVGSFCPQPLLNLKLKSTTKV
jgi:hypothetical protein